MHITWKMRNVSNILMRQQKMMDFYQLIWKQMIDPPIKKIKLWYSLDKICVYQMNYFWSKGSKYRSYTSKKSRLIDNDGNH